MSIERILDKYKHLKLFVLFLMAKLWKNDNSETKLCLIELKSKSNINFFCNMLPNMILMNNIYSVAKNNIPYWFYKSILSPWLSALSLQNTIACSYFLQSLHILLIFLLFCFVVNDNMTDDVD